MIRVRCSARRTTHCVPGNSKCHFKALRVVAERAVCLLLVLLGSGCGSQLPEEFTVSGKPIEYWLDAQLSRQPETRARAVRALANVDPSITEIIPAMEKALADSDPGIRRQAALALLKFGPAAIDAVPALTQATGDRDENVRKLATQALEKIQGK